MGLGLGVVAGATRVASRKVEQVVPEAEWGMSTSEFESCERSLFLRETVRIRE